MPVPLVPGQAAGVRLRGELRYGLEVARLGADREFLFRLRTANSAPVLLVPGFMAGDHSLTVLRGWRRRRGSRTAAAGIRLNAHCGERAVRAIERRLRWLAEGSAQPSVIVSQSRGGELARVVALRNPQLVSTLVMLGSPVLSPLGVDRPVLRAVRSLARLGDIGLPGMFSTDCADGECSARFSRG